MLVPFTALLDDAAARGAAVGAFTAYNLEGAAAALSAGKESATGVMILISEQAFRAETGRDLIAAVCAMADRSEARCCVQLDHVSDLDVVQESLAAGVGAVMADGSRLPFDQNVKLVQEALTLAARTGAQIEAELGYVAGDEEMADGIADGALTDPDMAFEFVARTGAQCLAVSIGNAHGRYRKRPHLDWDRLDSIRGEVPVALSLHGASGIADHDLRRCVAKGIRKVNINTELRERYFDVLSQRASELALGARLLDLNKALYAGLEDVVKTKLKLLNNP